MAKYLGEIEIPAQVGKHGGDNLFSRLHQPITNAWELGSVPQTWKDASIVTIYKKGNRTDCGKYRIIYLLSISGKIFARILRKRLSTHIKPEVVPETQRGFRGNRSTVEKPICLRQLQEKSNMASEGSREPWIRYFVSDRYKKSALSKTDLCTWYFLISVKRSIQLGGPGYDSF